ncbi:MAG: hypothetical protein JEZ11_22080 [Desulfobacterales bacterium]|nr:hypothetical protein [Desulfobacterales bacterium]
MPIVDLSGAYDLHIHSNPSLFTRIGNDFDMARHAAETGLAGILLKNHFESTVGRAAQADAAVEETRVFGGLVLNGFAGGINPLAVENALGLGAKQIWMPTIDAVGHATVFGKPGGYGYQDTVTTVARPAIGILDENGTLTEATKTVVALIQDAGAILGTAHLSREEIFALADHARAQGFDKLLITHPYFNPPQLSVDDQKILVEKGALLELCGGNLYPIPGTARLSNYLETIQAVGTAPLVLSSDAGQPRKSLPQEVLRIFAQCLMEKGITQEEIDRMTKINPARLLGI